MSKEQEQITEQEYRYKMLKQQRIFNFLLVGNIITWGLFIMLLIAIL
jgi:hypothetical protein